MTNELLTLIATHFACAEIAEARRLSYAEAVYCNDVYQEVKLAFVPDVDTRQLAQLSQQEQIAVNKAGYLAYYEWRQSQPDTVDFLERVARGEVELGHAG